jgi:hypothetical protein
MKIKSKGSVQNMERNLNKQRIELESALLSANFNALDLVNPNEAYLRPANG